jgi:hypothetical protein
MSAQISPSQKPPLANFAPIKPLLELKRGGRKPDSRISKALEELFQHKHRKDREIFREIYNVGQRIDLMINGKQFLCWNPYGGGSWGFLPIQGSNSSQRPLNILNNLKQNLLTKWENSNPDVIVRAGRNTPQAQSAAKSAAIIVDYYERQFYNRWFTQQQALMGMTFGTYINRYRYDADKVSMTVMQDIFEQKDVAIGGEGVGQCGDCGYEGTADEFAQNQLGNHKFGQPMGAEAELSASCPNCGSDTVQVQKPQTDKLFSVSGQQEKSHGDLVCELLPLPACRWDLAVRPEDSRWFMYRQRIPKGAVTRVLGNVLIPDGKIDSDAGLEVLRALNHQGQPLAGKSAYGNQRTSYDQEGEKADTVTFDELWLSPDDYSHINLMGDEPTVDGDTIPKGKLTDVFPDGLCAVGLNGMSTVLALYSEQHRKHVVSGTWFMRSQTGAGRGLADSVEIQSIFNTLNNQALDYMSSTYSPAIMYDNQILTGNKMKYIGTPKTNIPVDLTKLPDGRKLSEAIHQMQPTAMPAQFFNFAQNFMSVMAQKTSMVTDFSNGEPGITAQNTTATAAEIDQGNADAINQSIFLIKADVWLRGAELTVNQFREHFPMKRYFDLGGEFGQQQGVELSGADVCTALTYDVVKNSEMPKGPFTRQKNRMQFFNVVGGMEGLIAGFQTFPKVVEGIAQDFDVDLEIGETADGVNDLCLRRLGQMQQAAAIEGVTDPGMLVQAIEPPISQAELELKEKSLWFARWLSTDDGQNASMPLRQAVELLAQGQFSGYVQQSAAIAQGEGTIEASKAAPAAMGQAQLEQQSNQQPEQTQPDPSAQLQYAQEQSTQQHEAEQNALDRQHESAMLDKEAAKEKSVTTHEAKEKKAVSTHDAREKIRIERAKPKPKPVVKAKAKK